LVTGTWIVVVTVLFCALAKPRWARMMVGTARGERWVMVVSIERVVVLADGMEIVRRLRRSVRFRGYVCR
jgi:hypothetical protein